MTENILLSNEMATESKKNVPLAVVYSLLLPGMGELYAGDYGIGKYFTVAEGGLWIMWTAFQLQSKWVKDDSRAFATQYAGASLSGKSDQYFVDIGNFQSVHAYNEQVLRDRDAHKLYDPNSADYWNWDTPQHQEQYRQLRVSSDNILNNANFVLAAIGVNHIISAVNAGRLVIKHNKQHDEAFLDIRARVIGDLQTNSGIMLTLTTHF
jgi:TM2 domain-containing membrane protein YozV